MDDVSSHPLLSCPCKHSSVGVASKSCVLHRRWRSCERCSLWQRRTALQTTSSLTPPAYAACRTTQVRSGTPCLTSRLVHSYIMYGAACCRLSTICIWLL